MTPHSVISQLILLFVLGFHVESRAETADEWRENLSAELLERITARFPDVDSTKTDIYVNQMMGIVDKLTPIIANEEYRRLVREATLNDVDAVNRSFFDGQDTNPEGHQRVLDQINEAAESTAHYLQDKDPAEYHAEMKDFRNRLATAEKEIAELIVRALQRRDNVELNPALLPAEVQDYLSFLESLGSSRSGVVDYRSHVIDAYFYLELHRQGEQTVARIEAPMTDFRYSGHFLRMYRENTLSDEAFQARATHYIHSEIGAFSDSMPMPIADRIRWTFSPLLYLSIGFENFPSSVGIDTTGGPETIEWRSPLSRLGLPQEQQPEDE